MSEEKKEVMPEPIVVTKTIGGKEITIELVPQKIKKGTTAGKVYFAPKIVAGETIELAGPFVEFHEVEPVLTQLRNKFNTFYQGLYDEAVSEEDGTWDREKFIQLVVEGSPTGEPMAELERQRDENLELLAAASEIEDILKLQKKLTDIVQAIAKKKRPRKENANSVATPQVEAAA
jgi:hypothetical protein